MTGLYTREDVRRYVSTLGLRGRGGEPVSAQTFEQMLRKPVYAGKVVVPQWDIDVRGRHQALVDEDTFYRVQAILQG